MRGTRTWSRSTPLSSDLTGRVEQAGKDYQAGEEEQTSMLQQRFAGMEFNNGPIL